MMRPKKSAQDLPPRMLRRTKTLKSGKVWEAFYYNGRREDGTRWEMPLGSDLNEAKRKWAELECKPAPADTVLGDWYANLIRIGRIQVVLAVSERSLLPVVVPARDSRALVQRLCEALEPMRARFKQEDGAFGIRVDQGLDALAGRDADGAH